MSSTKFAPRKSLKTDGLAAFSEVQNAFRVAGAGISTRYKIRGRCRNSGGVQKRRQAQEFCAL